MMPWWTTEMESEREAVLQVVREFDAALDRGEFAEVERLSFDDLVFFGSGAGEESVGPASLASMLSGLREEVAADFVAWELTSNNDSAVRVRGDAAVVTASAAFRLVLTTGTRSGRYLQTYVLHRGDDGWQVWSYHGSEPQPW
jgi:ketosteroid isomerase-like protein